LRDVGRDGLGNVVGFAGLASEGTTPLFDAQMNTVPVTGGWSVAPFGGDVARRPAGPHRTDCRVEPGMQGGEQPTLGRGGLADDERAAEIGEVRARRDHGLALAAIQAA
jgi:hypothetical protein